MASGAKWIPRIAVIGALLIGCAVAWRSYEHHQHRRAMAPPQPTANAVIYPDGAQAESDIAAALKRAAEEHKRVLLDFGGNWCGDCRVLQLYFHDTTNQPLLESNYVLVPVNIGRYDQNLAIAARYSVPIDKGVPALAVIDPDGHLIYSQRQGEFEAMRTLNTTAVTAFLLRWKG